MGISFLITCEYIYIVNMVMGKHSYGYRIGHNSIKHHIIYMPLHALLHRYMQPMVLRRRRNLPDYYYYYGQYDQYQRRLGQLSPNNIYR